MASTPLQIYVQGRLTDKDREYLKWIPQLYTMVAGAPTESSPKQKREEGGFDLIWLVQKSFLVKK